LQPIFFSNFLRNRKTLSHSSLNTTRPQKDGIIGGAALVERPLDPSRRAFMNADKQPSVFHRR